MLERLFYYLQYPFVINALIVATLIALTASLLGVILFLRRYSFLGDSLSHIAFGVNVVATILHLFSNLFLVLPLTIMAAILILKKGERRLIKSDALLALLSTSFLAFGYLMMNIFSKSANVSGDVCATLFGSVSILTLTTSEVTLCIFLCLIAISYFFFFYHYLFALTFDEDFVKGSGLEVKYFNLITAIIIAIIVVLAMNLVGSLLVTALIVFPGVSASRISRSFKGVTCLSAIFSIFSSLSGLLLSILFSTPVGSTIVATNLLVFLICYISGAIKHV